MLPLSEKIALKTGIWLFLDLFVVSFGGWLFWLFLSMITTTVNIGYATTVISIITLTTGIFGFGLDYAMLRETLSLKGYAYGTIIIFETLVLSAISPVVFMAGVMVYGETFAPYMMLAVVAFLVFGLAFISKFTAVGVLKTKIVFFLDVVGAIVRVLTGILLVIFGFGGFGIITAGILQQAIIALSLALVCYRAIGFKWGGLKRLKSLLKIGLSNFPAKISTLISMNLSVVLLAGATDPSSVGVFYIVLMITLVIGGFATSIATMAIPTSANDTSHKEDPTVTILRLGLCLTAPFAAILASSSEFILSLVGEGYRSGSISLVILAVALFPTIIVSNAVSKLNRKRKLKQLIMLGLLQITTFLTIFSIPSGLPKIVSTSLAILASSIVASTTASKWLSREVTKPIALSGASFLAGCIVGLSIGQFSQLVGAIFALSCSFILILLLKGVTFREIHGLLKMIKEPS